MLDQLTAWLAGENAEDLVPSHLAFNVPVDPQWCFIALAAVGAFTAVYIWTRLSGLHGRARTLLVTLRTAIVVLVLFLVLDPSVIAQRIRPGEQFVLLLFDDSKSMRIAGRDGQTRGERMVAAYKASKEDFEARIARKHQLARYRFGGSIEPLQDLSALDFDRSESNLVGGVVVALSEFEGTLVSAVVVFSDGVQQTEDPASSLENLPAGIPVFTVGVDTTSRWSDAEIGRLSVKRTDFDQSPVSVSVDVHSTGLARHEAVVEAMEGKRVVASRNIEISEDEQDHEVRLEFVPTKEGWQRYQVRVRILDGTAQSGAVINDRIEVNNSRSFVVDNRKKTYKVLYVSGRPSWENKFVRRALDADEQLAMTSIIAISNAAPKFVFRGKRSNLTNPLFEGFDEDRDRPRYDEAVILRLGPDAKKLMGYPSDARPLFEYNLVLFGDVEKEFFTNDQLDLTRDFVEKRGGSLLVMGGPNSFTEGRYSGTVIEGMLPIAMYPDYEKPEVVRVEKPFSVQPTMEGSISGSWSFATDHDDNRAAWEDMPLLFGLNRFLFVRPGATVMAETISDEDGLEGQPFFAVQRYGEGKCAVLATSDTWQWQLGMDEEDEKHEQLWRQTVRNLVHDTPSAILLRNKKDEYTQGEPAAFEFVVRDALFDQREGLQCSLTATSPSGVETGVSLEESIQEVGVYTARFAPDEPGLYTFGFSAVDEDDEIVGSLEEAFIVEADRKEFLKAQYDAEFLERVAVSTQAGFYTLNRLSELAEAIPVPYRMEAEEIRLHLWHESAFYIVLVSMMMMEWYLRRRRGQA